VKKVDSFILDDPQERQLYEELMNKHELELIRITREEFAFLKSGAVKIVVWYTTLDE
jgi:hypothetical protein